MSKEETEITFGEKQTFQHTLKIDSFNNFMNFTEEVKSEYKDVFNGEKIAFNVIPQVGIRRCHPHVGNSFFTTDSDKFFILKLLTVKGFVPHSVAGKVDILLAGTNQTLSLGNENGRYHKFDAKNELILRPDMFSSVALKHGSNTSYSMVPHLVHVKLTGKEEVPIEIKFTLFYIGEIIRKQERKLPDSLRSSKFLSDLTMKIMNDESTADLKITCGKKDNKKIFKVHKSFMCAISPVFRAAIESDMLEGVTSEIYIEAGVGCFLVS